jgi:sulfur carrier protein ThiS
MIVTVNDRHVEVDEDTTVMTLVYRLGLGPVIN